ncbi:hypothetical protein J6590_078630 [Homalodisca vitripennis]|nr:hypothetical protein J6590_078630 [Homalodisca vitripennis]
MSIKCVRSTTETPTLFDINAAASTIRSTSILILSSDCADPRTMEGSSGDSVRPSVAIGPLNREAIGGHPVAALAGGEGGKCQLGCDTDIYEFVSAPSLPQDVQMNVTAVTGEEHSNSNPCRPVISPIARPLDCDSQRDFDTSPPPPYYRTTPHDDR